MPPNKPGRSSRRKVTLRELSDLYDRLLKREAQLRAALYSIGDALMITDTDGSITLMNPAAERLTGWTESEALALPIEQVFRIVDEDTRAAIENPVTRTLRTGTVVRLHHRTLLISRDGREIPIADAGAPIRDESGDMTGVILTFYDQTLARAALQAAQMAREFAENIIATVREPLLVLDSNLRIVSVNHAFYRLFRTTPEETLDRQIYELGNQQWNIPDLRRLLEEILTRDSHFDGYAVTHEFEHIGQRTMLLNARRIRRSSELILLAIEDITERIQAEQKVQSHLRRLRALRTIDQAIISAFDMRVTLDILLEQIRTHLHVDAAALHLLDPHTQTLTCAAAHGFQSRAIQQVTLRTGEGYAGQVALGRRTMFLADLRTFEQNQFHLSWMHPDTFVSYCGVPLIARGQIKGVLEIFHRTRLDPEQDWFDFLEALSMQAAIAIDSVESFETLQRSNAHLVLAYEATIRGWAHALDLRDRETEGHSQRVTELTVQLARAAGLSDEQIAHIRRGALLHDIGKLGIPDSILLKPGSLTPEEWVIMRRHPEYAFGMLSPIEYLRPALDIPYCHHERWDGTGYPRGLKGDQIPLAARLFAVADVWDALQSDRPYRARWPREQALEYIRSQAGKHFDPEVVELFLKVIGAEADTAD